MSITASRPLVLVVGGAGKLGQPLINAIIEYRKYHVAILTRPESLCKPAVEHVRSIGVEIRLGDFARDPVAKLADALTGVDILISTVNSEEILDQKNVLAAAKLAEVKRVVPCDFGTACPPGRRVLHDQKLEIRAFVRGLGVPYTFIDVGWWMQLIFPYPSCKSDWVCGLSHQVFGTGDVKTAVTDLMDVGRFVARIIEDSRTVNEYVFCWAEHVSQNDVYKVVERIAGERFGDQKIHRSKGDVLRLAEDGMSRFMSGQWEWAHAAWVYYEYVNSIYFHEDNTLEKAKSQGALDARELYPDFRPIPIEESAIAFYSFHNNYS